MNLQRADEVLRSLDCPQLQVLQSHFLTKDDVLISCAGFEDRAFEFLRRAIKNGSRNFDVIGVRYSPFVAANRVQEFEDLAKQGNANLQWVVYDREEPQDIGAMIPKALSESTRVFIDVSGMSRLLIVQLLATFVRRRYTGMTQIVYAQAEKYPPEEDEVEESLATAGELFSVINFISSGVFGIIIPPGLSTVSMYGQPIRLVAFPSFNSTQFVALRAEINASAYTIINGTPPDKSNAWREESIAVLNDTRDLTEAEQFSASTLDYRETISLLLDTYGRHGDREKLVIAPTGSKMQTVAVGIVTGFLRDIQIVYPAPRSFPVPENYTKGVREIFGLDLCFLPSFPRMESPEREYRGEFD